VVTAHVWYPPASTWEMPLVRPDTSTGVGRCVVLASPSCPSKLAPQHLMPPPVVSAQVWYSPALTATMPLESAVTSTGASRFVVELSPSCPKLLSPQHLTAPPVVTAQLWYRPAPMELTPLDSPETATGVA